MSVIKQEILAQVEDTTDVPASSVLQDVRILFAEDSEEILNVFREVVQKLGWKALYVNNAVEMISLVNNLLSDGLTLDGIVADLVFFSGPKVTNITAVREIRKAMPKVPVLFISPFVTSMLREEVRRVDAEIIETQKPFDSVALFTRLSQLIYWNKLASSAGYEGPERRITSINKGPNYRRAADYILSIPHRIAENIKGQGGK